MNIYIDKPNLLSVIHSVRDEKYSDCMRMLKENFRIYFTFAKNDIDSLVTNDKNDIKQWLTQMTTGVGFYDKKQVKWESEFPTRPLNISKFNTDQLASVYCLSKDNDPKLEAEAKKGNLIIALEGQEIGTLSSLFFNSYQFTKNIFREVLSWNDLENYLSPCTDIIITDLYLLSDPELYQQNLYSLIRVLGNKAKNSSVNIVIFTLKTNYNKSTKVEFEPDWDTIYTKIRKCADKHSSFKVTFVTASKQTLGEHDRTIFTNYKCFSSGDSFNYFDSTGKKITNCRWLHVHSIADKDNAEESDSFLKDMQNIINDIQKLNNDTLIKKDKSCNFLNFT